MKPYVYGPKFMWNLDCSVGKGGSNNLPCDVSFIQWYYALAAGFHLTEAANKLVYRKVQVTGQCSGRDDDPLVAAILIQQRSMNHPYTDGKVSVVSGTGLVGTKAFFLLRLEARFAVMYPNAWPRTRPDPELPAARPAGLAECHPKPSRAHAALIPPNSDRPRQAVRERPCKTQAVF